MCTGKYKKPTRLHSSRMRTARLLPVSLSKHCAGAGCAWSRRVSGSGGGVPASGPGGVPASGPEGCIPACNGADLPL